MNELKNQLEQKEKMSFQWLREIFSENFNPQKTLEIIPDVDSGNQNKELISQEAFWTEIKNPDTGEVVEGKIYLPRGGQIKKLLIISPGYRGDFVLQEAECADDFVKDGRGMIVLRHNGLRVDRDDMKNYVHCPQKSEAAVKAEQKYLGNADFDFMKANREVLTALKSLSGNIQNIDQIDIVGHSWGGHIALNSLVELKKEGEAGAVIAVKIKNLVLMGAWLENREEVLSQYKEFFESEAGGDYFQNMDGKKVIEQMMESANNLKEIRGKDLPQDMRIVGIHSVGDKDIDLEGETLKFFEQIKDSQNRFSVVLKDLKDIAPKEIGGRETETHDYNFDKVRGWIKLVIDKK